MSRDAYQNFKAQEIDTPGVIQQVSHLFRGFDFIARCNMTTGPGTTNSFWGSTHSCLTVTRLSCRVKKVILRQ